MLNVIILTYNNLNSTKKCLKNLYAYTKDFNLVVIDNNSTDKTIPYLTKLSSDKGFSFIKNKENTGVILGRNQGYSFARKKYPNSEYSCFLDNDQFVKDGWQESHMKYLKSVFCPIVGVEGWWMRDDFYPSTKAASIKDPYNYVGCGGMMVKNEFIDEIGLFDERFSPMYFEDPDLCFKALSRGREVAWNYNPIIEHQPHKLLNTERKIYFNDSWRKFKEKWRGKKATTLFTWKAIY